MIKKLLTVAVILLFMGMSVVPSSGNNVEKQSSMPSSSGTTFYVDDDFNETTPGWNVTHFDLINNGIEAANNEDIIIIYSGTYPQVLNINKKLHLQGIDNGRGRPKILGKLWRTDVYINADGCIFENIILTTDFILPNNNYLLDPSIGLQVNSNNNTIRNCISESNGVGLYLNSSWYNTIYDNIIRSAGKGIRLTEGSCYNHIYNNIIHDHSGSEIQIGGSSNYNLIENNQIFSSGSTGVHIGGNQGNKLIGNRISSSNGFGLQSKESKNLTLLDNTFINDGIKIEGDITHFSSHTIQDNNVDGKPIYYYVSQNDFPVPPDGGQVILFNCSNVLIQGLKISDTDHGIYCEECDHITITENEVSDNSWYDCIHIIGSSFINISNNSIGDGDKGIYVESSNEVVIEENTVYTTFMGIAATSSENIVITNNHVSNCEVGVISDAINCIVTKNFITTCSFIGIAIDQNDTDVSENLITLSVVGVFVLREDSIIWGNSFSINGIGIYLINSNNMIENNNFLENGLNARFERCRNTWRNNFWNRPRVLPKIVRGVFLIPLFDPNGYGGGIIIPIPLRDFDMNPRTLPYVGFNHDEFFKRDLIKNTVPIYFQKKVLKIALNKLEANYFTDWDGTDPYQLYRLLNKDHVPAQEPYDIGV